MQTQKQLDELQLLCVANDLQPEQLWQHKQSGHWILSRTGVEKIIAKNKITVKLEMVGCGVDFAVVKATAAPARNTFVMYADAPVGIESFGSAQPGNVAPKFTYFAEMAEKRAKGRAVLQLAGFYQLGVYSEDEATAFKRENNMDAQGIPATPVAANTDVQYATAAQKNQIIGLLDNEVITAVEKNKVLLNINRLDEQRATEMIAKLCKTIDDRETVHTK